jgi:probable rRNA maturation factor
MKRRGDKAGIRVDITSVCADPPADPARLERLAAAVCVRFGKTSAAVSIAMVDDAAIRKVNEEFLGKAHETDVISFDLSDGPRTSFELVVNVDEAVRQGRRRNHSVEAELALYVTHGLLHHLGFDDAGCEDARRMHAAEDAILEEAGFGRVYGGPPCDDGGLDGSESSPAARHEQG